MCNLYSLTTNQAAIRQLFAVAHDLTGSAAVLAISAAIFLTVPSSAATDDRAPADTRTVRLKRPSFGCPTAEGLFRAAKAWEELGDDAVPAALAKEGCREYSIMHGPVMDETPAGDAACVLGLTNFRCIWFGAFALEPARPL